MRRHATGAYAMHGAQSCCYPLGARRAAGLDNDKHPAGALAAAFRGARFPQGCDTLPNGTTPSGCDRRALRRACSANFDTRCAFRAVRGQLMATSYMVRNSWAFVVSPRRPACQLTHLPCPCPWHADIIHSVPRAQGGNLDQGLFWQVELGLGLIRVRPILAGGIVASFWRVGCCLRCCRRSNCVLSLIIASQWAQPRLPLISFT